MKKIYIRMAVLSLVALFCLGATNIVSAADASLYVSPASKSVKLGDVISGSVGISAGGNKIYAVEGTLVFDKLSCQSISVASGLQALTSPTCDSPKFILGIPSGSSADKTLLTLSTKASTAGTATISVTGVKIVGGDTIKTISTSGGSGSYIVAGTVVTPKAPVTTEIKAEVVSKPVTKPIVKTLEADVVTEAPIIETSPVEVVADPVVEQGTVLGGFEAEIPNEAGWSESNVVKILIAVVVILILFIGYILLKKKKN